MPSSGNLSYEDTLGVLQGFLGLKVAVMISGPETGWLPIAFFRGVIASATTTSASGHEAIMFRFGGEQGEGGDTGFFILAERFQEAVWDAEGKQLTIDTADGTIRVYGDSGVSVEAQS